MRKRAARRIPAPLQTHSTPINMTIPVMIMKIFPKIGKFFRGCGADGEKRKKVRKKAKNLKNAMQNSLTEKILRPII